MLKKVKIIASALVSSGMILVANKVSAANYGELPQGTLDSYITSAINFAIWAAGLLSVVFIIIGGFQYITAGTSKDGVTKAKNTLLYAIIGLIIVLLALIIRNFVLSRLSLSTPSI